MMSDIAVLISILGTIVTIAVSITVLIVFKRNSKETAVQQGRQDQAQHDNMSRLETKLDNTKSELSQKIDGLDTKITEVRGDIKNLNARMEQNSTNIEVMARLHEFNHPGQIIGR